VHQYLDLVSRILKDGDIKSDRTGVGTKSIFGHQMRFDLSKGFPLVTTKQTFIKPIISELLWFLEGSTDERRLAEILYGDSRENLIGKKTIWTANADEQGKKLGHTNTQTIKHLGKIYSHGWRYTSSLTSTVLVEVERAHFIEEITKPTIEDHENTPNDEFVGQTVLSNTGTEYKVLKKINTQKNSSYEIQALLTGHKEIVTRPNLKNRAFGQKIRFGRFYSTIGKDNEIRYYHKARIMWRNMINRCYDVNNEQYYLYGGAGVFVDSRWYDFKNFLHDLERIPFFYEWSEGTDDDFNDWCLDKDYYNTNKYSLETCIFLPSKENKFYSNTLIDFSKKRVVEFSDGVKFEYICFSDLNNKFPDKKFNNDLIKKCIDGKQSSHKDCKFYEVYAKQNHKFRKKIIVDQISDVIDMIKTNPDSRRLIVSAWNVGEIDFMSLPPCHTIFQFYVNNGKLSCQLYQRSVDTALGLPFNIASYALLTMMIAQITNLQVGEFIHTSGDAHIYANHFDSCKLLLDREPLVLPSMILNKSITSINDFTMNDFTLVDYKYHNKITMEMAI